MTDLLKKLEAEILTPEQTARATAFQIGDLVEVGEITRPGGAPWAADWLGVLAVVYGVAVDLQGTVDISLRHDRNQMTDGFAPEDLILLSRRTSTIPPSILRSTIAKSEERRRIRESQRSTPSKPQES